MGDILKTGYLTYAQKKVIKTTWSKKYFALLMKCKQEICLVGFQNEEMFRRFEAEKNTIDPGKVDKRLKSYAQVIISNIQCLKPVLLKGQDAMETMTDSGKKFTLLADEEGSNQVDSWVITYQFASSQNALASLSSGRGPPSQLTSSLMGGENENDLYESTDEGISFQVLIIDTEASSRLNLYGNYELHVNSRNLTLVDMTTKKQNYVWPFKYLRRYGRTSTEFSFEAGRRCESGEGLFKFCTLKGNEIFYIVEGMATAIREKERQNSPGSSFRGGSAPPVSNVPRPTSLRQRFMQVQSKSMDAGVGMESKTAVYAEPIKKMARAASVKMNMKQADRVRNTCNSAPQLDSVYQLAGSTSSPGQNNNDEYAMIGEKSLKISSGQETKTTDGAYENVDVRPPVPPKLHDSPKARASMFSKDQQKALREEIPLDEADYANPDDLEESEYAYASAEDVKRDLKWMKKPEPGAVTFQIESTESDVDYDY